MSTRPCIVVTGASRGIGAAIAQVLAAAGYEVGCLSRSGALPTVRGNGDEVNDAGDDGLQTRFHAVAMNVTDRASWEAALAALQSRGLKIAGLVNNAGLHLEGRSTEIDLDHWQTVINTNATSVVLGCQSVYPYLTQTGGGLIVNIGSFFDKLGVKRNLAYCASKAAVGAITRCLAVEWAGQGIRVLDVAPGYIETDLNADAMRSGPLRAYLEKRIPSGHPGTALDVANLVGALYSSGARFMSGETLYVDGAQGIAH
jgi:NAD(P)-dependent dehydrogenase (short-subunit alcohol dehydrogenase family)